MYGSFAPWRNIWNVNFFFILSDYHAFSCIITIVVHVNNCSEFPNDSLYEPRNKSACQINSIRQRYEWLALSLAASFGQAWALSQSNVAQWMHRPTSMPAFYIAKRRLEAQNLINHLNYIFTLLRPDQPRCAIGPFSRSIGFSVCSLLVTTVCSLRKCRPEIWDFRASIRM